MAYPFKPVEHQVYRNTFLKDVRVAVEFRKVEEKDADKAKLQRFFDKFHGAGIESSDFLAKGGINVFSNDQNVGLSFGMNYAEVKLSTPAYTSFDAAMPFWNMLTEYLEALGVKTVVRMMVRKYSALYFKSDNEDYDVRDLMSEVFCKDLMKLIPTTPGTYKALSGMEKTWTARDEENGTVFNAVFGIKKSDSVGKSDHLTLVTSIETDGDGFDADEVIDRAQAYNKILFDAFHWCVKKEIIEKMQ